MKQKDSEPEATFRYLRKTTGELYATVCVIQNETRRACGISIVGDGENFNRKIGRKKSLGRARRAYYTNLNSLPMKNSKHKNIEYFMWQVVKGNEVIYKSYVVNL